MGFLVPPLHSELAAVINKRSGGSVQRLSGREAHLTAASPADRGAVQADPLRLEHLPHRRVEVLLLALVGGRTQVAQLPVPGGCQAALVVVWMVVVGVGEVVVAFLAAAVVRQGLLHRGGGGGRRGGAAAAGAAGGGYQVEPAGGSLPGGVQAHGLHVAVVGGRAGRR